MTTYNKVIINGVTKIDLSGDNISADKVLSSVTQFHDANGATLAGTIQTITLANATTTNPTGSTNKQTVGRSTSTRYINIPAGYHAAAEKYTISAVANMTLPTAASSTASGTAKLTVTPGTADKYINIPTGYNGTASYYTVAGDVDLVAENIANGKEIFGVTGTIPVPYDYVIETGSYGTHTAGDSRTFYYQKWYGGKLEVWFSDFQDTANGSAYGNMYYRQITIDLSWFISNAGLPAFVNIPYVQITMRYSSNLLGCSITGITSTSCTTYQFGAAQSIHPQLDSYWVGRWKA